MIRVTVELWLWLGKDLGNDWQSVSTMRSLLATDVEEGTTVQQLFEALATCYEAIGRKVFIRQSFLPSIVVIVNDRLTPLAQVGTKRLEEGDKITVLHAYSGG